MGKKGVGDNIGVWDPKATSHRYWSGSGGDCSAGPCCSDELKLDIGDSSTARVIKGGLRRDCGGGEVLGNSLVPH